MTGKTAFSVVRAHIFTSVECLGLYFNQHNRTHNTKSLLLKNNEAEISVPQKRNPHTTCGTQQSLDRAIFATKHISLASPRRVFATFHLSLAFWYPSLGGCSQLFLICFPLGKLLLAYADERGFLCGGAPPPAAPRPWPSCSPEAQFCAFERTTCWVK